MSGCGTPDTGPTSRDHKGRGINDRPRVRPIGLHRPADLTPSGHSRTAAQHLRALLQLAVQVEEWTHPQFAILGRESRTITVANPCSRPHRHFPDTPHRPHRTARRPAPAEPSGGCDDRRPPMSARAWRTPEKPGEAWRTPENGKTPSCGAPSRWSCLRLGPLQHRPPLLRFVAGFGGRARSLLRVAGRVATGSKLTPARGPLAMASPVRAGDPGMPRASDMRPGPGMGPQGALGPPIAGLPWP